MKTWIFRFLLILSFGFANDLIPIGQIVKKFQRPFTFLIIAKDPSLFLPMSKQYSSSTFVFLNPASPDSLQWPSNAVYLQVFCNIETLQHLSESEHFDIVYVNDHRHNLYIPHYNSVLQELGEHIFLSFPSASESCLLNLSLKNFSLCKEAAGLYSSYHSIPYMKRTNWFEPSSSENHVRNIVSTYTQKILYKNYGINPCSSTWLPGINLLTFKILNGRLPTDQQLKGEINRLYEVLHRDWMPNNMIVQGSHVKLIDLIDPNVQDTYRAIKTPELLSLMHSLVLENNPSEVYNHFEKILIYTKNQLSH